MTLNNYYDEEAMKLAGERGEARAVIGGLWDELGSLQASFLKSHGLEPSHRILDLGCGCLRAGVKLVPMVERGYYFGIDLSASLLNAGRQELEQLGLSDRVPAENLRASGSFDVSGFPAFDFGIAQSVFTHLPIEALSACLRSIQARFENGRFFATFFIAPSGADQFTQSRGKATYADRDPFHSTVDAIIEAADRAGWTATWIGEWGHPKDQQMAEFKPQ